MVLLVDKEGTTEVLQHEVHVVVLFNPWCKGEA